MYGLNAVAFIFFISVNVLANQLCKCPERERNKTIFALCTVLLICNLLRYCIVFPLIKGVVLIPVEFSTVAYFAVPAILMRSKKKLHSWAAYSGLMAGFFYYLAMVITGGPLYASIKPSDVFISLFCHGTIYLCGFVTIGTEVFSKEKDAPKLAFGVVLVAVWAAVFRSSVVDSNRYLIYILMDAVAVRKLLPQNTLTFALPVYYIAVAIFVVLTIQAFFSINQKQYRKFSIVRAQI